MKTKEYTALLSVCLYWGGEGGLLSKGDGVKTIVNNTTGPLSTSLMLALPGPTVGRTNI